MKTLLNPMVLIVLLIVTMLTTACSQLLRAQDKGAEQIARVVHEYCANTDQDFRVKFRAAVNEKAAPNSIIVTCGGSE